MTRLIAALALILAATPAGAEPLHFYNGRLFITAKVNGLPTEALLDSAAEGSLIDPAFAAKAKLPELRTLDVAGKRFRHVPAAIDDQPSANDLNLGTSILKRFLITTDFSAKAVWLDPRMR